MKSISLRLTLIIALVATAAVAVCGTTLTMLGSNYAHTQALDIMRVQAREQAMHIANLLNPDVAVAKTIAGAGVAAVQSGSTSRVAFDAFLKQTLVDHPSVLGTWIGFEPNALDNNDAAFAGTAGYDATGRYVPYFARGKGNTISRVALADYDTPGVGDYYQLAKTSGHPVAIEPYVYEVDGEQVLMTSMTFPVTVNGKFLGVGGVDLKLDEVGAIVGKAKPLGTGYVAVVSSTGLYVANRNPDSLGKKAIEAGLDKSTLDAAMAGEEKIFPSITNSDGVAVVRATAPVILNGMLTPWSVVVTVPEATLFEANRSLTYAGLLTGLLTFLGAAGIAYFVGNAFAKPIRGMTEAMKRLAGGDHRTEVPARERKDEIGAMAAAVQVFKENGIEMERVKSEQEENDRKAVIEKKRMMNELASSFEAKVGSLVQALSAAATEMESTAGSMTTLAEQGNSKAMTVASASEQTSANVQTVATATEELSASIQEISKQVANSARIASKAVDDARSTDGVVQELAVGAHKIGEIIQLINDIAGQTNLLALNATIEAARAGDAGKGFAVVASEVKSLATQTAKATEEISAQITQIQGATDQAVTAIKGIGSTIQEMSEIAAAIASAVEEQGAATLEISRNVQQAAQGTEEVSRSIVAVRQASTDTGVASAQVFDAAGELSRNSNDLSREVDNFLAGVKAA
ncbi:MAG TPA: methyl-accepting chemotaxis protein [Parvibaculum sp.]|jgi:methyl-accepting chemotaxis protein